MLEKTGLLSLIQHQTTTTNYHHHHQSFLDDVFLSSISPFCFVLFWLIMRIHITFQLFFFNKQTNRNKSENWIRIWIIIKMLIFFVVWKIKIIFHYSQYWCCHRSDYIIRIVPLMQSPNAWFHLLWSKIFNPPYWPYTSMPIYLQLFCLPLMTGLIVKEKSIWTQMNYCCSVEDFRSYAQHTHAHHTLVCMPWYDTMLSMFWKFSKTLIPYYY